jgi:alkane 1-monooxygenase
MALHYLKFFLFHALGLAAIAAILAGGSVVPWALAVIIAFYVIGDAIGGDDLSTPRLRLPGLMTAQLWLALPLVGLLATAVVWSVSPDDRLGLGAFVQQYTSVDLLGRRIGTTPGQHFAGFVLAGLMIGMVGTIPGHELTHRTRDRISMIVGRWLLAFSFDTVFSVEHVYGHHRYVATRADPATAPRGRSVYTHIVVSTLRSNISGWRIEAERLTRMCHAPVSWRNRILRGQLMSLVLLASAWSIGGWRGLAFFIACGLWAKALLEIVNYMEHYGLVREPGAPVQPRHSWNSNRRISSWSLFNLTRHSHHHANAGVPYHDLRPFPDAPEMIGGYLTTILLTLVPPLWSRLMAPRLASWDRDSATPGERQLVRATG